MFDVRAIASKKILSHISPNPVGTRQPKSICHSLDLLIALSLQAMIKRERYRAIAPQFKHAIAVCRGVRASVPEALAFGRELMIENQNFLSKCESPSQGWRSHPNSNMRSRLYILS
ncbi:hypothetical protein [Microseira wollei]|uniref:Transposase n=1 Tax=Microseira wollei NIES-4236 TaxID=2530354 RepID=A0AAV3XQX1_9CYAN|nr:hypothetical protein [Microseira wollei]GET44196.1 hypothetical protein MiSe_90220 [Microseira wollei NIES-4236]